jgi:hypothetical protein
MTPLTSLITCFLVAIVVPVAPQGLDFTLYICTSLGNCQPEQTKLLADYYYVCEDQVTCNEVLQSFSLPHILISIIIDEHHEIN